MWKPNEDKGECGEKIVFNQALVGFPTERKGRILGGSLTTLGEINFMALLGYETLPGQIVYSCGASIINKWYVLTTAECIDADLR